MPGDNVDYEYVLDGLWDQTDRDGNGELNLREFTAALDRLGVTVGRGRGNTLRNHDSIAALFNELDADSDGGLTKLELAKAIERYPAYRKPLIRAFTNGAGEVPRSFDNLRPSPAMNAAAGVVTVKLVLSGPPSSIYPGTRKRIRKYFADTAGVATSLVIISFTKRVGGGGERNGRALQANAGSTAVNVTIFTPDEESAAAVAQDLPVTASEMGSVPAFSGLTVMRIEAIESEARVPPLPTTEVVVLALGSVLALLVLGVIACLWTTPSRTAAAPEGGHGCCSTGCCSFNAVMPWAFGELLATALLLAMVVFLYRSMEGLTNEITGLVTTFNELVASNVDAVRSMSAQLPPEVIDALRDNVNQLRNLPFAVIFPGLMSCIFLLLGTLCPPLPMNKGSYLASKCMFFFATVFLLLSLIFYLIFVSVAVALTYPPPVLLEQINLIRGICLTVPAELNQMITDNTGAIDQLEAGGQDVSTYRADLAELDVIVVTVTGGCGHLRNFLLEIMHLYLPAMLCVIAIIFAFVVNQTLCCATGCCKSKPGAPAGKVPPKMAGIDGSQMTDLSTAKQHDQLAQP